MYLLIPSDIAHFQYFLIFVMPSNTILASSPPKQQASSDDDYASSLPPDLPPLAPPGIYDSDSDDDFSDEESSLSDIPPCPCSHSPVEDAPVLTKILISDEPVPEPNSESVLEEPSTEMLEERRTLTAEQEYIINNNSPTILLVMAIGLKDDKGCEIADLTSEPFKSYKDLKK